MILRFEQSGDSVGGGSAAVQVVEARARKARPGRRDDSVVNISTCMRKS